MNKLPNGMRVYNPSECAVFCRVKEPYGLISNMASGFPLKINEIEIRTSEALYQACRFPLCIEAQKKIIAEKSPMSAKMVGKPFRKEFNREDFEKVQMLIMRWSIRVKLLQNWNKFSQALLETGNLSIVEESTKGDDLWGAVAVVNLESSRKKFQRKPKYMASAETPAGFLVGYNFMGRLAQELRENLKTGTDSMSENFTRLAPLPIENFLLYGEPIREVFKKD